LDFFRKQAQALDSKRPRPLHGSAFAHELGILAHCLERLNLKARMEKYRLRRKEVME